MGEPVHTGDMRISEVAALTRLSVRYWQRRAASGQVPGVRVEKTSRGTKSYVIDRSSFLPWWNSLLQPVTPNGNPALNRLASRKREADLLSASKGARCWVYFIACAGRIKIGHSTRLRERLGSYKSSNPGKVVLIGLVEGGLEQEEELHEMFSWSRERGEWFRPTPDLLAFIEDEAHP